MAVASCRSKRSYDVVIVGGGIAGLSVAWHLARAGVTNACVVERERACGTHASGQNAAIFRHLDADAGAVRLAQRSRALMGELGADLVRPTGAIYLASDARLRAAGDVLRPLGVTVERLSPVEVAARAPLLANGASSGAFLPADGVIDTHGVMEALQRELRRAGVEVRTDAAVAQVHAAPASGVVLCDGERLRAPRIVLAGGAWSAELAGLAGLVLPIEPRRRHLALLEPDEALSPSHPIVWRLDDEVYFRPESGGVLACPCDEDPWPAGPVPVAPEQLVRLGELLSDFAPSLGTARVRRAWGCLRSFAPDRQFVVGADARAPGLYWLAGLGGRGMTCGLALGEVAAAAVLGRDHERRAGFSPARFG